MELQRFARESEQFVREYEYDDGRVIVVDLGGEGSVDVVDDTAIVVLGDGSQFELAVPEDAAVFINNGVLTVEVTE